MSKKKEEYLVIPVEEQEMQARESPNEAADPTKEEELEERFDKDFWLKVKCIPNLNIGYVWLPVLFVMILLFY